MSSASKLACGAFFFPVVEIFIRRGLSILTPAFVSTFAFNALIFAFFLFRI